MHEPILVLNAGSSGVKFSLFENGQGGVLTLVARGEVECIGDRLHFKVARDGENLIGKVVDGRGHDGAAEAIHRWCVDQIGGEANLTGVGHRIVHGGPDFGEPVLVDNAVIEALESLIPLAPLHQPHNIAAIRAIRAIAPNVPQVACFDTAFHRDQPAVARAFALPRELTARGIRRYGFHGLSYESIVSALPRLAPECVDKRLVVAHLGNGASMCAVAKGRSVATTMSFTALDGLPMGTRSGNLDPGVILYLMRHDGMGARAIEPLLYEQSGLLGVSGISSDMRTLLASGVPAAKEAVDLFVYRIGRELGSLAAALEGLDALIFTGGIGEHAPEIRARVCRGALWLGIELDEHANARGGPRLSTTQSTASAWMVPTDENLTIARHTRDILDAGKRKGGS